MACATAACRHPERQGTLAATALPPPDPPRPRPPPPSPPQPTTGPTGPSPPHPAAPSPPPSPLTLGPLLSVPPEVVAAAMYSTIVLGLPRPSTAIQSLDLHLLLPHAQREHGQVLREQRRVPTFCGRGGSAPAGPAEYYHENLLLGGRGSPEGENRQGNATAAHPMFRTSHQHTAATPCPASNYEEHKKL
jgi:hypothetical protein